ncbi:hypothetical protein KUCAC02_021393, partial [Chaenocephalus aceratus]
HPSPLGFYYSLASRHTESHVKAGHRALPAPSIQATSFPSNYSSSHPESRGQRWTRLAAERLMAGNGEGRMNPGQMGINKETGLKDASCYG